MACSAWTLRLDGRPRAGPFEHECFASALIVLLTSMDIMASLDRPEGTEEVSPEDFIRWAERYLTPGLPHNVTGEEIYSAGCAVLHALGAESRRTRAGRARRVGFIVGGNMAGAYNPEIDPGLVLLNLEMSAEVFFRGIVGFLPAAFSDARRREVLEQRLIIEGC